MNTITRESTVAEIVQRWPHTRRVFDEMGLKGCGGGHGPVESLEFFAQVHQVDIERLVQRLREEAGRPAPALYVYKETLPDFIYRRFFKAGVLIVLTAGSLWGAWSLLQIGLAGNFLNWKVVPAVHAHANAMIYGWVGLFVMGFIYQSLPRFKNTTLWRPDLANMTFVLMLIGIGGRIVAEMWQPAAWAVGVWAAAGLAQVGAVTLFLVILFKTAQKSVEPRQPHEKFMAAAMIWFFLSTLLNEVFFFAKITADGDLVPRIALLDGPLREMQLLGFAAFIIAGVSQRLLPAVYGLPRPSRNRSGLIFALMTGALVLNLASYELLLTTRKPVFSIGLQLAYTLMPVWAVLLVRQLGIFGKAERPDRTLKFIRAAYAWLLVAAFMMPFFLLYGWLTGQRFAHAYMGAQRHAFTVGFISLMIMGVSAKIVPILAGVDTRSLSGLWGPFLLMIIGNALRVTFQIATDFVPKTAFPVVGFTGFIEVVGLAWWGYELWRTMNLAKVHREKQLAVPLPIVAA